MRTSYQLAGYSVLVLEDDFYVAEDTRDALSAAGAHVLGPCATAEEALAMVEANRADCAIVDLNLGSGPSSSPTRSLMSKGVPVVLFTGYDLSAVPQDLANLPYLQKPADARQLVATVRLACGH